MADIDLRSPREGGFQFRPPSVVKCSHLLGLCGMISDHVSLLAGVGLDIIKLVTINQIHLLDITAVCFHLIGSRTR